MTAAAGAATLPAPRLRTRFENGLEVRVLPVPGSRVVSTCLAYRVGTRDELFWQQGTHAGYRSYIFGLPGRGQGLAIMMSAGARDAEAFSQQLLSAIEREYRLPRLPG